MKIVAVGDSQAEGLKPYLEAQGIQTFDHRGWSTRRLRDEALAEVLATNPDAILLITGGNDDPTASTYPEVVRSTATAFTSRGAKLYWVGPVFARVSPDSGVHPQVATAMRNNLSGKSRVVFIDAQPLTRDLARTTNVHLTSEGYRTYAQRLLKTIGGTSLLFWAGLALAAYAIASRRWWVAVLPP